MAAGLKRALPGCGHDQGGARVAVIEAINGREFKKPLGIGLGMAGLPEQLRQSRRQHGDWQLCLAGAVERGNQRGELRLGHVLQFIDKEHKRGGALMRRLAEGQQEIREIGVEIAAVGQADFRIGLNAELDIPIFDPEGSGEARQRAHALQRMILQRLAATQTQKRRAQRRDEQGRQ